MSPPSGTPLFLWPAHLTTAQEEMDEIELGERVMMSYWFEAEFGAQALINLAAKEVPPRC